MYGIINEALKVAFFLLQEMIFKMTFHKQNDQWILVEDIPIWFNASVHTFRTDLD